jgi:hypothetical protein
MLLDFVNFLRTVPMHTEGNIELISDVDNDGVTLQNNYSRLSSKRSFVQDVNSIKYTSLA